ncbi:MAG: hypothetical protein ACE5OQ_16440 [Woeseia sp.]
MDLEPKDPRQIYSVQVADAMEAALLQQPLKLEPIAREGSTLYFFDAPGLNDRLRTFGYEPIAANPYEVYRRVVRVERRGSEQELIAAGIRIINREKTHWVVEGSLANLRMLERSGYRLSPLPRNEPRPREVRIRAKSKADVAKIGALHIDIYSVVEVKEGFEVYAGAFDYQIDRLREKGFTVQRISTVKQGVQP